MATTEIPGGGAGHGPEQLLAVLEPDQLTGVKREQLPRRYLKGSELLVVWSLRIYLLFMIAVVVYQIITGVE